MDNTGRIKRPLCLKARQILFQRGFQQQIETELKHICNVDCAHLIMLAECGIVDKKHVVKLLCAIDRLVACDFEPLRGRESTRGLFFVYEDYMRATEGDETGGILQTARSRNDLNATVLKLRIRKPYLGLIAEGLRLQAVMLRRARCYAEVVMPAYTHGQPATPSTYGHYLAGVATALMRDLRALMAAVTDLNLCPLGASAVTGTSLPIDVSRTASLLGFERGPMHSVDAVASRDALLRLLSAVSIFGITLSRMAADLLEWTTVEFGFFHLPDELVGSSSAMPQKRNPFILEHVVGRSTSALGAFVSAISAMHGAPFSNSIAVGTEAVRPLWQTLQDAMDVAVLMRLVIGGARPNPERMLRSAHEGFTSATELANRLATESHLDFRTAHNVVGKAISACNGDKHLLQEEVTTYLHNQGFSISANDLDLHSIVRSSDFGGGPGKKSFEHCWTSLKEQWTDLMRQKHAVAARWRNSQSRLEDAMRGLCGTISSGRYAGAR